MSIRNKLLQEILTATQNGAYYVEVARFQEDATQTGAATLDALSNVTLGSGGSDPEGILTVGTSGVVTVNKSGPLFVKQSFQVARDSNPGNAEVFFQAQASADGGVTWTPLGSAVNRRIANDNIINVFFDVAPVFLNAGVKLRNVWAKSSVGGDPSSPTTGVNNGLLISTQPSAALTAAGVPKVPSALAVFYKLSSYNYE